MRALGLTSAALTIAAATVLAASPVAVTGAPAPAPVKAIWTEPDAVMAGTATTTTTSTYKFSTLVGGKPVRWNPCAAVHWKFRAYGAPSGGLNVVKSAIARVAKATGITFVYDGTTTSTPTSAWLPTSTSNIRPMLIGWTDGYHSDLLRNRPKSVLGVTRTAYFGGTVNGVQVAATKAAVIALDRTDKLPLTGAVSWKTTMLHELAHAMGLDHVTSSSQLMYPVLGRNLTDFNYGDRNGLYKVGKASGCVNIGY